MEKIKITPRLRFSEFEGNWGIKKLGEVGEIISGLTYSPKDISSEGILVLRSSNVKDRLIKLEDNVFVNTTNFNKVITNDILICVRNGSKNLIGKNALINKEQEGLAFGAFMIIYRSELNLFIFQLFDTKRYYKIINENLGATINSINNADLRKFEFYFPSLPEQTKIASFLSTVDYKLQALKQKKTLLEQYKKGVSQKLFSQEIRFKDDVENDYPDWEEKKLSEISRITTGSSNREDSNLDGEFTFFDRSQDIRSSNRFLFDAEAIIVPGEGQEFIPKYFIGKFDLHQRTYAIMDIEPNNGKFLFYYIGFNSNHLNSHAVGSTVKSLRLPMFEKMPIKLPSQKEQTKIANFLSAIDDKINHCREQIANTEVWKKGLLQQMFC
jgi:type I restriction enzyme S subunit